VKRPHRLWLVLAASAIAATLLPAAAAYAGSYSVVYNNGSGCGIYTAVGTTSDFNTTVCGGSPMGFGTRASSIPAGTRMGIQTNAPAGIAIIGAQVSPAVLINVNNQNQWGGGSYYSGGGSQWVTGDTSEGDSGFGSSYWGFQLVCGHSPCTAGAVMSVNSITLTASEGQGPSLTADGSGNLWYQGSHWVWNPPGDPWSIELSGSDPSGACELFAIANGVQTTGPSQPQDNSTWQQCPDWTWPATLDTRDYVSTSGPLSLTLGGQNAAGVQSTPSETLEVDNDPVTVSFSTSNDANPSVWVNHAVTVDAAASAGPSGVAATSCSVDGGAASAYPAGGLTVNGNGVQTVSCTANNGAVDPQGAPNTGSATEQIKIDEAPPSVSFEPENPADPTALVVDTSDNESGVAGGSITMSGPGLSSPVSLPTSFDGSHLLANFDDSGLHGTYTFTATSCDNVGNCATTTETMNLPVRVDATSDLSFAKIQTPTKIVHKRVLVDYRYKVEQHHGKRVRVKVGGHYRRIRIVIPVNTTCGHKRVKVARRRWREITVCRVLKLKLKTKRYLDFGRKTTIHGLLITPQGAPIAGAPVTIETAPDNGTGQFSTASVATTSSTGAWSATLRAGPSRIIHAVYAGSPTILPATGQATVTVPAKIRITSIEPRSIPWGATITITGELSGGYLPPGGALVELRYGYGHAQTTYGVKPRHHEAVHHDV
jgi:hypothetical protein